MERCYILIRLKNILIISLISSMQLLFGILLLLLAIGGMAIGIIFNNKPLSGSCGGLNPDGVCSFCGGDTKKCDDIKSNPIL